MPNFIETIRNMVKNTIIDQWYYYIFVLTVLVSSLNFYFGFSAINFLIVVATSISFSFLLVLTVNVFKRINSLRLILLSLIVAALNLMCITDTFLISRFDKTFDDDVFFVIFNTASNEAFGFLKTFVDLSTMLKVAGVLLVCNAVSFALSRLLIRVAEKWKKTAAALTFVSVFISMVAIVMTMKGVVGIKLKNCNVLLEYIHPIYYKDNGYFETQMIINRCRNVDGQVKSQPNDSTIFVLVIGESHNTTHTSLYGYRYNTMPRMKARMDNGSLVAFDKCLSRCVVTHKAYKTILSLSKGLTDLTDYALFPVVFREAGYRTECYDNQFTVSSNLHIITDPDISAMCFDYRTSEIKDYDGEMVENIAAPTPRSMVLINLNGQHFAYADRIPNTFEKTFSISDYDDVEDYKREIFCDYDNATCYVDSVLESIIEKYQDYNTCLIYMSDHGEDIWDSGSLGHGHGLGNHQRQYITCFVWGSDKFRDTERWKHIVAASNKLIASSDISHVLLDLAGIEFHQMDYTRSFVNTEYVERDHYEMIQ